MGRKYHTQQVFHPFDLRVAPVDTRDADQARSFVSESLAEQVEPWEIGVLWPGGLGLRAPIYIYIPRTSYRT